MRWLHIIFFAEMNSRGKLHCQNDCNFMQLQAAFAGVAGVDFVEASGVLVWGHDESGSKNFSVPEPSTLNTQHSTLNTQPCSLHPES
jgi:hypothetical protein